MSLRNLMAGLCLAATFAAATADASAVGGAISHGDRVQARRVNTYYIDFYGGEYAEVAIIGDGDTDLDLYVYDQNGNLIGSSQSYSDVELVGWTPLWTGTFTVEVHNLGNVYNQFGLGTN